MTAGSPVQVTRDVRLMASGNVNVATRCVIVDPAGCPSIRIDANRDGNRFNG